ncbi:hypothetical protein GGR51DRAFT_551327 [Nemania sp. FL0031]|nr:hypothetical protein GGR51DRAFT_551327 [Nemania sp. FL0031]
MSVVARQPFAPLNQARLQRLTSQKNRQNAISITSPGKRKASDVIESDNSENVDPIFFSKRAKGIDGLFASKESLTKAPNFFLTKSASANALPVASSPKASTPRRTILNPTSPVAKLNTNIARASPLSAPAGRSPTRKRSGLLSSRRRTAGSFTRVDPPIFGLPASSSPAPFSLDAALRGTIANYSGLHEPEMKPSWFFSIHEDTEQEYATNMLEHSALTLDISSDEESENKRRREREECKENIPPADDISQTSRPRAARLGACSDEMVFEKERSPLREMNPREYYANGYDENSVVLVEDDDETYVQTEYSFAPEVSLAGLQAGPEDCIAEPELAEQEISASAEELMQKMDDPAPGAAVLEPVEGTGESFEVWESSSAKDEAEAAAEC